MDHEHVFNDQKKCVVCDTPQPEETAQVEGAEFPATEQVQADQTPLDVIPEPIAYTEPVVETPAEPEAVEEAPVEVSGIDKARTHLNEALILMRAEFNGASEARRYDLDTAYGFLVTAAMWLNKSRFSDEGEYDPTR
jgi:hypothetical protein